MPTAVFLGEFEQLVLLSILRLEDDSYALPLRDRLNEVAGRSISRGALYRTLDRLEEKGYVTWEQEDEIPGRGGHPRRKFSVTRYGVRALRASRNALLDLWDGLEHVIG